MYKTFPVNLVKKHMEHDFLDCLTGKFQGVLERRKSYRSPVSSGRNVPNSNSGFYHHKKLPENPVGSLMEHDFSGHSSEKFPGATEHLKRESCFSCRNISNGN